MTAPVVLVLAKAPLAGRVKTRIGAVVGMRGAAELAAAALVDTLDVCEAAFPVGRRFLAVDGDLAAAAAADEVAYRARQWTVLAQRGHHLGDRLVNAHRDVAALADAPVIQIGMDTPQVTPADLEAVAALLSDGSRDVVIGPAEDGGWWVLGTRSPRWLDGLGAVPMSRADTYERTHQALEAAGAAVAEASTLYDVDTVEDAARAAAAIPRSRFAAVWSVVRVGTTGALR